MVTYRREYDRNRAYREGSRMVPREVVTDLRHDACSDFDRQGFAIDLDRGDTRCWVKVWETSPRALGPDSGRNRCTQCLELI